MSKIFHVMYDDDAKVMAAASDLVGQGVRVKDVFSPFPIHGIDPSLASSARVWPSAPSCTP